MYVDSLKEHIHMFLNCVDFSMYSRSKKFNDTFILREIAVA